MSIQQSRNASLKLINIILQNKSEIKHAVNNNAEFLPSKCSKDASSKALGIHITHPWSAGRGESDKEKYTDVKCKSINVKKNFQPGLCIKIGR